MTINNGCQADDLFISLTGMFILPIYDIEPELLTFYLNFVPALEAFPFAFRYVRS